MSEGPELTRAQRRALEHHDARAERARSAARDRIERLLVEHGAGIQWVAFAEKLLARGRMTLSFHPDRLRSDGVTVVEGLLGSGRYLSQFQTGVTNGSPTAFVGGERDTWEEKLFGGAYQELGAELGERPKYGAFDLVGHDDGGSPRFGSCHLVTRRAVWDRCTLTWGDSHEGPEHVGSVRVLEPIVVAMLEGISKTGGALGLGGLDLARAIASFASPAPKELAIGRALDAYIEAQVHGDLELARDFEGLVIDPSFSGTEVGAHLEALAIRSGLELRLHAGYVLSPSDVPADFRGPRMVALAARVMAFASRPDRFDVATIGRAAASLHREPERWADWGTAAETWQHLKQLWHVLVRYGRPHASR